MLSQNDDQIVHKLYVLSTKNTRNKISWNESILTTSTKYLSLESIEAALLIFFKNAIVDKNIIGDLNIYFH